MLGDCVADDETGRQGLEGDRVAHDGRCAVWWENLRRRREDEADGLCGEIELLWHSTLVLAGLGRKGYHDTGRSDGLARSLLMCTAMYAKPRTRLRPGDAKYKAL